MLRSLFVIGGLLTILASCHESKYLPANQTLYTANKTEVQSSVPMTKKEQKKWDEGTAAASNAIALRALVSAVGLSTEATAWISHGDKAHAVELYHKALTLLDPNRQDHDGLRQQIEHVLADLDPPKATKTAPRKKQP